MVLAARSSRPSIVQVGRTDVALVCGTASEVHDAVRADYGVDPRQWLNDDELDRLGRFKSPSAAASFLSAHVGVRRCVAELAGIDPSAVVIAQRCDTCGGNHGRPRTEERLGLWLSLSHSDDWVSAVASRSPVATDIERWRRQRPLTRSFLHEAERDHVIAEAELVRLWSAKECLVKLGRANIAEFAQVNVGSLAEGDAQRVGDVWFANAPAGEDHTLTVAVETVAAVDVAKP